MNYLKISVGIFIALAASRFVPHPPNFTSLLALSFYVPALIGIRYLPSLIISFVLTDLIIGFHGVSLFTWGSVIVIALMSKYFISSIMTRILGSFVGACLFYLITNFGVWSLGSYGYSFNGIIECYILAIPFFTNTLISTIVFSFVIEALYKLKKTNYVNNFFINIFYK